MRNTASPWAGASIVLTSRAKGWSSAPRSAGPQAVVSQDCRVTDMSDADGITIVEDIFNESAPYTGYFAAWLMWPALFDAVHDLRNHRSVLRTGVVVSQFFFTCAFSAWISMSFYEWLTGWTDGGKLFWSATVSLVIVAGASFLAIAPTIEVLRTTMQTRRERRRDPRFDGLTWIPSSV